MYSLMGAFIVSANLTINIYFCFLIFNNLFVLNFTFENFANAASLFNLDASIMPKFS